MNIQPRLIRQQLGISQRELAEVLGVSRHTVLRAERGELRPPTVAIYRLLTVALGFGLRCAELEGIRNKARRRERAVNHVARVLWLSAPSAAAERDSSRD